MGAGDWIRLPIINIKNFSLAPIINYEQLMRSLMNI